MTKIDEQYKVTLRGFMWIGIILIIIILALVVLALKPTVVVNNYINPGDYSFDVGPRLAMYMDKITNQTIHTTEVDPYYNDTRYNNTIQFSNDSKNYQIIAYKPNISTMRITINLSCVEETPCDCAINTTTPCMMMCFKEKNNSGCHLW